MNDENKCNISKKKSKYRLAIILPAYDPYKDVFDIFISEFKKNWPDCPYPLIISNMFFDFSDEDMFVNVIHSGNEPSFVIRRDKAIASIDADYYIVMEEDRIISEKVDTSVIEEIMQFMDKESIDYFRCNPSPFRKKSCDKYEGYEHYFHILAKEPYGVCGSTVIQSKELILRKKDLNDPYQWEEEQLKNCLMAKKRWAGKYITDDRNVFHIVHCIEKQKWIRSSKRYFKKKGYSINDSTRPSLGLKETALFHIKNLGKRIPIKLRYNIKKIAAKIGFKFVTKY